MLCMVSKFPLHEPELLRWRLMILFWKLWDHPMIDLKYRSTYSQGCHFPDNMKFPDFSKPRLSSTVSPRPFRGVWGYAPPENFENLDLQLGWKWISDFRQQNSPTFGILSQIPWLFQVFQGQWQPCIQTHTHTQTYIHTTQTNIDPGTSHPKTHRSGEHTKWAISIKVSHIIPSPNPQ